MLFTLTPSENIYWLYLIFIEVATFLIIIIPYIGKKGREKEQRKIWIRFSQYITGACALAMLFGLWLTYHQHHSSLEIKGQELIVHTAPKDLHYALDELELDKIQTINFKTHPSLQPTRRLLGTSYKEFNTGKFRLRGGQKAFVLLTHDQNIIYIPTKNKKALLFSLSEPDAFIERIKNLN